MQRKAAKSAPSNPSIDVEELKERLKTAKEAVLNARDTHIQKKTERKQSRAFNLLEPSRLFLKGRDRHEHVRYVVSGLVLDTPVRFCPHKEAGLDNRRRDLVRESP